MNIAGCEIMLPEATRRELRLNSVLALLTEGNTAQALRYVDRAWRTHPRQRRVLALLYGRLLFEQRKYTSALRFLIRAAEVDPQADTEAAIVETLLILDRGALTIERLESAIKRFAVEPGKSLAAIACRVVAETGHTGWVGISPSLELIGEIAGARRSATLLQLCTAAGESLLEHRIEAGPNGTGGFSIALPWALQRRRLLAVADGAPLLGSGLMHAPDFLFDGRVSTDRGLINGWMQFAWAPADFAAEALIEGGDGRRRRIATTIDMEHRGRRRFGIDPMHAGLGQGPMKLWALLPDGSSVPFPDAPLLLDGEVPPFAAAVRRRVSADRPLNSGLAVYKLPATVIIPVFLGREETLACIESVLATVPAGTEIIVVDDATPDRALAAELDQLAFVRKITLLRNLSNLGFPGAVNRALGVCADRDAVVLNADALVFGDWLERLQSAAYSAGDVGSVTPMTNCGTVASYPFDETIACSPEEAAGRDRFAASELRGETVELPVGVGFCLYLRRDCLNETGLFDEAIFGKGYGEESDLCMRARHRGWRHLLAADVYVFHAGGKSFGLRRAALLERSHRLINLRHPGYDALVNSFSKADPVLPLRRRFDEWRLRRDGARYVLLLTLAFPGGVSRFIEERSTKIRAEGLMPLILKPAGPGKAGCVLQTDDASLADLRYSVPRDLAALRSLLQSLSIEHVELHHFLDFNPRVVEMVRALPLPYDVYIHDYIWLCPRLTLTDGNGRHCGEPALAACEACIARNGSDMRIPISVASLRQRSAGWLADARRVIAPINDVAARITRYFPAIQPDIEPWEALPERTEPPQPTPGPVRIAVIGAIAEHKGYRMLLRCARQAAAQRLPIEFVLIGYTDDDDTLMQTGKVFVTGRYTEADLAQLLQREQPDLLFFPSVGLETWCYTLTRALATGLPIVAFDIGAVAERLRDAGTGVLLPLDTSAAAVNQCLMQIASESGKPGAQTVTRAFESAGGAGSRARIVEVHGVVKTTTNGTAMPRKSITEENTEDGKVAVAKVSGRTAIDTSSEGLSASVQFLTLPHGFYFISVRTAVPLVAAGVGKITLPAVQISLGPGVLPGQIEFMSGPATHGTWLCQPGNMLVAKVVSAGVVLALTSVRTPGGGELAIRVERLETNLEDAPVKAPAGVAVAKEKPEAVTAVEDDLEGALKMRIGMHVRGRGDLDFVNRAWAGRVGSGLWIEAFSVTPLERFTADDIEYKGLTASGFETPWLSGGASCGTRGMAVPLIGFAVRLKPGAETAKFDCEYSGFFNSGTISGPLRNGTPCRSMVASDPLEGIKVRIVERKAAVSSIAAAPATGATTPEPQKAPALGPRFGKFRDSDEPVQKSPAAAPTMPPKPAQKKPVAAANPRGPQIKRAMGRLLGAKSKKR